MARPVQYNITNKPMETPISYGSFSGWILQEKVFSQPN